MLRPAGDKPVRNVFGMRLMHPSATRSIRIEDGEANEVMRKVLAQYADFIGQRREFIRQRCPDGEPDLRTGWVLWQSNLKEFVYFEEETLIPSPADFIAEWHENEGRGGERKAEASGSMRKTRDRRNTQSLQVPAPKFSPILTFRQPATRTPIISGCKGRSSNQG